jgi:hypothetical protein
LDALENHNHNPHFLTSSFSITHYIKHIERDCQGENAIFLKLFCLQARWLCAVFVPALG